MRLKDKVVLVAGAGGPMGTAVPLLFAQEGARVVLAARREQPLQDLARWIHQRGGVACWVTGDVLKNEDAMRIVAYAVKTYGGLDILYNNVGDFASAEKELAETTEDEWHYLINVNLNSAYLPCKCAIPVMKERGAGVIINVSAALIPRQRGHAGYGAGKSGLIGFTQNLARALKAHNIRVHCLCPGSIGPLNDADEVRLPTARINRSGEPEDVAYAALYLASDESAWLTGIVLPVDGGSEIDL